MGQGAAAQAAAGNGRCAPANDAALWAKGQWARCAAQRAVAAQATAGRGRRAPTTMRPSGLGSSHSALLSPRRRSGRRPLSHTPTSRNTCGAGG
jgi:hypothetical protein